jgi:hypothetical protein
LAIGDFVENDTNLDFNLFEQWDGTAWTATTVQVPRNSFQSLSGASADATNDAWAVGFQGVAPKILAKHWDGTNWTTVATPHVAGDNMHWDGSSRKIVPSPNPTKGSFLSDSLQSGVTPSPGNIWIFGQEAEFVQNSPGIQTLALHTTRGIDYGPVLANQTRRA